MVAPAYKNRFRSRFACRNDGCSGRYLNRPGNSAFDKQRPLQRHPNSGRASSLRQAQGFVCRNDRRKNGRGTGGRGDGEMGRNGKATIEPLERHPAANVSIWGEIPFGNTLRVRGWKPLLREAPPTRNPAYIGKIPHRADRSGILQRSVVPAIRNSRRETAAGGAGAFRFIRAMPYRKAGPTEGKGE